MITEREAVDRKARASTVERPSEHPEAAVLPADHVDLLTRPLVAALTTILPDGRPQTQPVWFSHDPPDVLINVMRGFRKERNMRADPRVTLLVIDPSNSSRWLEIRGLVELIEEGAGKHLDLLARRYDGVEHFFGGSVAAELAATETPIIGRVRVIRTVDERSADRPSPPRRHARRPGGHQVVTAALPVSHRDLLERPLIAILSTLLPDGHPQTQPVWFGWDGESLTVNTTREKQKGRNLERDPRATLLIVDPADSGRWIEVRADVEISDAGAVEHLDRLTRAYTPWPKYYGYVHPLEWAAKETRIVGRLLPVHVVCDAIHHPSREHPATG